MKIYKDSLRHVLTGTIAPTRGTPTVSSFGILDRHDCSVFHPVVTTKFQGIKNMTTELVWMMRGLSNNTWLLEHGCTIWDEFDVLELTEAEVQEKLAEIGIVADLSKVDSETLLKLADAVDVKVTTGDLGPVYGQMMARWPTTDGQEINQLDELIDNLRKNPFSRRHLVSMWNPEFLPNEKHSHRENIKRGKQVLPPCHVSFQVMIRNEPLFASLTGDSDHTDVSYAHELWREAVRQSLTDVPFDEWVTSVISTEEDYVAKILELKEYKKGTIKELDEETLRFMYNHRHVDLMFNMRSNDKPLGEPYNKANYATLLAMIAHLLGYERGELIHVTGNSHIYLNQLDGVTEILGREPKQLPTLTIEDRGQKYLSDFEISDFTLHNYESHPKIEFEMNV